MSEQRQRGGLFSALEQVLKAQGIRYRDLAGMMNTSEPTIKRLFQEQDCKISRLMEICQVIGLNFQDLVELAANAPVEPSMLSLETEQILSADEGLIAFFMLLVSEFTPEAIARENELTEADVYRYLRELEKLDLLRLGPANSVHLLIRRPLRWRLDGPLQQTLVRVNQGFIKDVLRGCNENDFPFYSTSRLLSEYSIRQLNEEVDKLYHRFQQQAAMDQMFYSPEGLKPFKMVTTIAPFDLSRYFRVPPFNVVRHP